MWWTARRRRATAVAGYGLSVLFFLVVLPWLLRIGPGEAAELRDTVIKVAAGVLAITAGWISWESLTISRAHRQTESERLWAERFQAAIELLGHAESPVRLGAIYALQRLAADPETLLRDRQAVWEILSAYVRQRSRPGQPDAESIPVNEDLQAAARILGRRPAGDRQLAISLAGANLMGAVLSQVDYSGADLTGARLHQARLDGARLLGACLVGADLLAVSLAEADLTGADLTSADLHAANLRAAVLRNTNLTLADLSTADLNGADLRGADVTRADLRETGLSRSDLRYVVGLDQPIRDPGTMQFVLPGLEFYDSQNKRLVGMGSSDGNETPSLFES